MRRILASVALATAAVFFLYAQWPLLFGSTHCALYTPMQSMLFLAAPVFLVFACFTRPRWGWVLWVVVPLGFVAEVWSFLHGLGCALS